MHQEVGHSRTHRQSWMRKSDLGIAPNICKAQSEKKSKSV